MRPSGEKALLGINTYMYTAASMAPKCAFLRPIILPSVTSKASSSSYRRGTRGRARTTVSRVHAFFYAMLASSLSSAAASAYHYNACCARVEGKVLTGCRQISFRCPFWPFPSLMAWSSSRTPSRPFPPSPMLDQ